MVNWIGRWTRLTFILYRINVQQRKIYYTSCNNTFVWDGGRKQKSFLHFLLTEVRHCRERNKSMYITPVATQPAWFSIIYNIYTSSPSLKWVLLYVVRAVLDHKRTPSCIICVYIFYTHEYGVLISLSFGKQQMHGRWVEWQIIYLSVIAEALSGTRIVLHNMYIGISEWEIRLLCYDCGGLYGLVLRKHSALHSWTGDGFREEIMGWHSKEYRLATTTSHSAYWR